MTYNHLSDPRIRLPIVIYRLERAITQLEKPSVHPSFRPLLQNFKDKLTALRTVNIVTQEIQIKMDQADDLLDGFYRPYLAGKMLLSKPVSGHFKDVLFR